MGISEQRAEGLMTDEDPKREPLTGLPPDVVPVFQPMGETDEAQLGELDGR